ncbi:MAG: hypothetical protein QW063_02670 [Candidatus Nanoarchaeia archaeon]
MTTGEIKLNLFPPCYWAALLGWNFFSFCSEIQNTTISNVTAQIIGQYDYILRWNPSLQAYELYSIYSNNNSFNSFDLNESYFIHFNSAANLTLPGSPRGDLNLSLWQLWNAPTYPYEFPGNVSIYLATINGFNYMLKWDALSQAYLLYSVFSSANPFSQIGVAEGQFIFTNASNATLIYNRTQMRGW